MKQKQKIPHQLIDGLWSAWCIGSVIGIWPRFIEPYMLFEKKIEQQVEKLPPALDGMKILFFSDLHLCSHTSKRFLSKIERRINSHRPHLILYGGDFLTRSQLIHTDLLLHFFSSLKASHGCFCILGNHDYSSYVSINEKGETAVVGDKEEHFLSKSFRKIFSSSTRILFPSEPLLPPHEGLVEKIDATPFRLLHNESCTVEVNGERLNICGLGDLWTGNFAPAKAFQEYDATLPGIVLSHNPDSFDLLNDYPGDVVLSGHTHGGQVNLPGFWKPLCPLNNKSYRAGTFYQGSKMLHVTRGVGGPYPFRWCAPPELTVLTLKRGKA
ncbi:metallophosphoesterase [Simkania negevensis]|uniref:Metallophosphoesterase n=1 Tax=Simkania negevensis TaxID=83561 RepID=A0ABS3AQF9_9BACT|nr:metallophosphoesterase [Simkania negevensis]